MKIETCNVLSLGSQFMHVVKQNKCPCQSSSV